ncbi:MAG: hypothetical protein HYZ51_03215 [Candidatus Doudnabacteria bacterium]|nr:hypothetical protein [Candidatus Doudnabacteria bacterium]
MTNNKIIFFSAAGVIIASLLGSLSSVMGFFPAVEKSSAGWMIIFITEELVFFTVFIIYLWISEKKESRVQK